MQNPEAPADADPLLTSGLRLVRAILRRKSGMSLVEEDPRRDNVDAIELYHDAATRLSERIANGEHSAQGEQPAGGIDDVKVYSAAVAYNVWADHLRAKYPQRTSLKNRLRYFLGHQPKYAVWQSAEGELIGGLRAWRAAASRPRPGGIGEFLDGTDRLPAKVLPRSLTRANADDWDHYLDALFSRVGAPVELDELVSVTAHAIGLQESEHDALEGADDDIDKQAEDTEGLSTQQRADLRSSLRQLWIALCRLKTDYRVAYLLNIPGPGKSHGDIEVFALYGIASIVEIGTRLALSDAQYQLAFEQLSLEAADAAALARADRPEDKFYVLWKHLPLPDSVIAKLLGLEVQQVLNRRMLAMRELARHLHAAGQSR